MVQRHILIKYLNRSIELETGHGTLYRGKIIDLDEWSVHFIPDDEKLKPAIISWTDIRKVILVDEGKMPAKKRDSIL
ncbi:MAG: hypothetical protein WAW23_03500 [Candidatus Methanoperedens sp.]|jgi:hypothetical protein